jgi:hypothetical protein
MQTFTKNLQKAWALTFHSSHSKKWLWQAKSKKYKWSSTIWSVKKSKSSYSHTIYKKLN